MRIDIIVFLVGASATASAFPLGVRSDETDPTASSTSVASVTTPEPNILVNSTSLSEVAGNNTANATVLSIPSGFVTSSGLSIAIGFRRENSDAPDAAPRHGRRLACAGTAANCGAGEVLSRAEASQEDPSGEEDAALSLGAPAVKRLD